MKNEKTAPKGGPAVQKKGNTELFNKDNYRLMLIGLVVMAIGFFLMAGGRSGDPNVFNTDAIYSFRRITLAPIFIVGGLIIEVFAIMHKSKDKQAS